MSKLDMLTPQNSAIALIDDQPAMYQGGMRSSGASKASLRASVAST